MSAGVTIETASVFGVPGSGGQTRGSRVWLGKPRHGTPESGCSNSLDRVAVGLGASCGDVSVLHGL